MLIYHHCLLVRSQHSVYMLTGLVLQQQQQHYKTIQTSCPNWAAIFGFGVGKFILTTNASRTYIWFQELVSF